MAIFRTIDDVSNDELARRMLLAKGKYALHIDSLLDRISNKNVFARERYSTLLHEFKALGRDPIDIVIGEPTPAARVRRYVDISCPSQIGLDLSRVSVVVRLRLRNSSPKADLHELLFDGARPVRVELQAPGFEILESSTMTTQILPDADSPPMVFELCPKALGSWSLTFLFFQDNQPAGSVRVPVEIVPGPEVHGGSAKELASPLLFTQQEAEPPDLVLIISHEQVQGAPHGQLRFTLMPRGGAGGERFPPVQLQQDLAQSGASWYEYLARLRRGVTPSPVPGSPGVPLHPDALMRAAKALGQRLWETLVPLELQRRYAEAPNRWRDRSLLVMSDEATVPWELLWPHASGASIPQYEEARPWCLHLRMARWLQHDVEKHQGSPAPRQQLGIGRIAIIAPTDTGISSVTAERSLLRQMAAKQHVTTLSPDVPTEDQVMVVLDQSVDWLHFSTHGKHSQTADTEAVLLLEGQMTLSPVLLDGSVQRHIYNSRPGVFLNACEVGQQAVGLTQLSGWPSRFLSAGAGLFLAPMWPATSEHALQFSREFYGACLNSSSTVGEALRAARQALWQRNDGDPTWLAYALYAHPNAHLSWQASS